MKPFGFMLKATSSISGAFTPVHHQILKDKGMSHSNQIRARALDTRSLPLISFSKPHRTVTSKVICDLATFQPLAQRWANFSIKSQRVNILDVAGYKVSVTTTQWGCCSVKSHR